MAEEGKKKFNPQDLIDALNNLDFENLGGWPMPIKIAATVLLLVVVLILGYMLNITDLNNQLARLQEKETSLMQTYEKKAFEAKNLDQYRAQLDEMNEQFGALLKQLPKVTEVPGLLEDITHTGEGSGLQINKIRLGGEARKKFYAELPIYIEVTGDYHSFGNFVSGVSALPRIVTLHDFSITQAKGGDKLLHMKITAETYRYVGGSTGK
jgi:type IV pilus assembly protein PilO